MLGTCLFNRARSRRAEFWPKRTVLHRSQSERLQLETSGRMSVSELPAVEQKTGFRRCCARFWRLFPHLTLCVALVAYTVMGALIFMHVEGGSQSSTEQEYRNFLAQIVEIVQSDISRSELISTAFTVYSSFWIKKACLGGMFGDWINYIDFLFVRLFC